MLNFALKTVQGADCWKNTLPPPDVLWLGGIPPPQPLVAGDFLHHFPTQNPQFLGGGNKALVAMVVLVVAAKMAAMVARWW